MAYELPFQEFDPDTNDDPRAHLVTADGTPKVLTCLNADEDGKASSQGHPHRQDPPPRQ